MLTTSLWFPRRARKEAEPRLSSETASGDSRGCNNK